MALFLILISVIIFTCVLLNNVSSKLGIPVLLFFIVLGILFGWGKTVFDTDRYWVVEDICSFALVFIMFYGGFGTSWNTAKPVVTESALLATVGVAVTAGLTGLFCHFALGWQWVESLLMGSVVSSTDAASVFSILRSRKLGLKNNTAPLLEMESGSNDPMSYMLTAVMISVLQGTADGGQVAWMIVAQIGFGALCGVLIAKGAQWVLGRIRFATAGFDSLFIFAVAIISYALPSVIGGNGYLSAYIVGIILGNSDFSGRKPLVHFFDGITSLMQVLIFFLLGLMAHPSSLHRAILPAGAIILFMMVVARPFAVGAVLTPFNRSKRFRREGRRYSFRQQMLISFVGLRGAASIVFAIMAVSAGAALEHDIFNIVFCIVLISIAVQGSLIPKVADRLGMIDKDEDVMKTFNDYSDGSHMAFGSIEVTASSRWNGCKVCQLGLPNNLLLVMVMRGEERIVPGGDTLLQEGDKVITCSKAYENATEANLVEHRLSRNSRWVGHRISEYPNEQNRLVVLIRRGEESIIPRGDTVLERNDVLVLMNRDNPQNP